MLEQVLRGVERGLDVFSILGGDERDGGVVEKRQFGVDILAIFLHGLTLIHFLVVGFLFLAERLFGQIPLVNHQQNRLEFFGHVLREFFVRLADRLGGIDQEHHHVGAPDGALGAMKTVKRNVAGDHVPLFADAGGVDDHQ